MKSLFPLNENHIAWETKFIYRVMHVCIEFELKNSDRKMYFPCFFDNPNWSV